MKKILSLTLSLVFILSCLSVLVLPAAAADKITSEDELTSLSIRCETDKDPLKYIGSDSVTFTFTLLNDGRPVTVPELRYTLRGDDGITRAGTINPTKDGKYVLEETCMEMTGYMYLIVDAYGSDGRLWKSKLDTSRSHLFEGGILVNAFAIEAVSEEPADFDEFWEKSLEKLEEYPADPIKLIQLPDKGSYYIYEVYINCYGREADTKNGDTYAAGYLAVPKNAKPGKHKIKVNYQGQGLGKLSAYGSGDYIFFNCLAHSVDLAKLAEMADRGMKREQMMKELLNLAEDDTFGGSPSGSPMYGMSGTVAANPEDVYYRNMLLRDVQAVNFLTKYFSSSSTATKIDGVDVSFWAGLWDGQTVRVEGGSQGGFQAIGVAALSPSVSELSASIPWLCDIGAGNTSFPTGTRITAGNRPKYAIGYDYVDTIFLAKRVTCKTTIKAGLGDSTCPASGTMAMFNNLVNGKNIDATMELKQGRTHGYNPDHGQVATLNGPMEGIAGWFIRDGVLYIAGTGVLDTSMPEVSEWNEQISEVKEIRISGAFTQINEGVFELENKADVYIYCQLNLSDRAFGRQEVKIYVPEDVKIPGAISLGKPSKSGTFLYTVQDNILNIKAAQPDVVLDFSELDMDFRNYVAERVESITSVSIIGEFAAIGKLKSIVETLTSCTSVKIDQKITALTSKQNFSRMETLETLGHWDFSNDAPVSYTEGVVDLSGFTKLLETVDVDYIMPEAMFEGCKSIKKIVLPAELVCGDTSISGRISKGFLKNCTALEEIVIPAGVTLQNIEYDALKGCSSLKTVKINGSVSPSVNIVFNYSKVQCFDDIPDDCKFICAESAGAQKLSELFAGAGLKISAVTSDGSTVTPAGPSDTTDNKPSQSGSNTSNRLPVGLIAAIAGGAVVIIAVIVIVAVLPKKKKK